MLQDLPSFRAYQLTVSLLSVGIRGRETSISLQVVGIFWDL